VYQQSRVLTPHCRQYRAVDAHDSKQVHVKYLLKLLNRESFGYTLRSDSSIVDDYIDAPGAMERSWTA
jgi:hypothetical protein